MLRFDINGDTVHGSFTVNGKTTAPKKWASGSEVSHKFLKVDCEGISLKEDIMPLLESQWFIRFQAKVREMELNEARGYTNKTVKFGIIHAKKGKIVKIDPFEAIAHARTAWKSAKEESEKNAAEAYFRGLVERQVKDMHEKGFKQITVEMIAPDLKW